MSKTSMAAALVLLCIAGVPARSGEFDVYLWETPRVREIPADRTTALVEVLGSEVQRILEAGGPLAPLRLAYADIPDEAYWLYYERGRIITTLAYAYPHVNKNRQEGIRTHVRKLLASDSDAPWVAGIKKKDEGICRQLHKISVTDGVYPSAESCPTLHVLYGLWLYGDRTGDWATIRKHRRKIASHYKTAVKRPILYGQMSGHIAMARLATQFDDKAILKLATELLEKDFAEGKQFSTIEKRVQKARFARFYEARNQRFFPGQPWLLLDASPEIMRFLKDHHAAEVTGRINRFEQAYPLWWLHQAPYFTRWTGDEGIGLPSEVFGLVFPVERWVKQTPAATLAGYMRSVPTGIGDCYWIESLVQTIEAHGIVEWKAIHDE